MLHTQSEIMAPLPDDAARTSVSQNGGESRSLPNPERTAVTFSRNALISVGRLLLTTGVSLALPAYLTHRLPVATYSAWVLILQMSAYVGYLDLGVQTGIAKYVAEYVARDDYEAASRRASAGLAIMLCTSVLGAGFTLLLAWRVPTLFRGMPARLFDDVRLSLVLVGLSLCFGLVCSTCSAIFLGLQQYGLPTAIALGNRLLFASAVLVAVSLKSSLATMGAVVAAVNLVTGLVQLVAWRWRAEHIRLTLRGLDRAVVKSMLTYCSSLAIWTAGMLCVSGLDLTIVGRYDFGETAFYAIAALPTNFMLSLMGAALAPLLPTASALSVHRTPKEMGVLLGRITRYSSALLLLVGLPLLVGGYVLLHLWVGPVYARHVVGYLRILLLANIVRNVCLPYSSMLVATNRQRVAIFGASMEAVVNLGASLYLVRHLGALGVAYGTLIGAFVSVGMHFAVSMRFTLPNFAIGRARLLLSGMLRPLLMAVPTALLVSSWWLPGTPRFGVALWPIWVITTVLLGWLTSLNGGERQRLLRLARL